MSEPRSPPASPPRKRKRPGASARIDSASVEAAKRRRLAHEEAERAKILAERSTVQNKVTESYNAVPQYGRDFRVTGSKIKGLRTYNNWVKSVVIQKFAPAEDYEGRGEPLKVLDIGCGKGGDLDKWAKCRQRVGLYVGLDPADVSIGQARGRYNPKRHRFQAEFRVKDCFGESLEDVPIVRNVGFDPSVGPGAAQRWSPAGFDVVAMMFCMHYAFESEDKARCMLRNVAGSLKKGGRFLGVIPNSDVLSAKVEEYHKKTATANGTTTHNGDDSDDDWDPEKSLDMGPKEAPKEAPKEPEEEGEVKSESLEWGNSIYRVKFPGKTPADGVFRPPFGWKYFYFLEEAVEEVPEYVVPWEAFRALAEDYNLELQYRKPFNEVWDEEGDDPEFGPLSERMGVRGRDRGPLLVNKEEMEAASFYHAFCFYKV